MNVKTTAMLRLKVVALTFLLFISFSIAGMVDGTAEFVQKADPTGMMVATLIMCVLDTLVLSYIIIRSRWAGWRKEGNHVACTSL